MIRLKYKDIKNRFNFYRTELNKNVLKCFFAKKLNQGIISDNEKKKIIFYYLSKMNTKYSKTNIQRRCIYTNRNRVSYRKFGIARIRLREMLKYNIIPGYKKAVW
jgi:ribosomal protein S14